MGASRTWPLLSGAFPGRRHGIPSYNAICSRCESMFRAPLIKPRGDGPSYCPGCAVYNLGRNREHTGHRT